MLAVLEEDRVAGRRVVARHARDARRPRGRRPRRDQLGAVGAGLLRGGERGGHDAGAGVQHRRQMRVVVVEGVREHAVDEGRQRGRQPVGQADRRRLRRTALLQHPASARRRWWPGCWPRRRSRGCPAPASATLSTTSSGRSSSRAVRRRSRPAAGRGSRSLTRGHRQRSHRRAGGTEDVQRDEHEGELVAPPRGQLLEVERLDDVDAVLDQQDPVRRQQRVPAAAAPAARRRWCPRRRRAPGDRPATARRPRRHRARRSRRRCRRLPSSNS